MSAGHADIILRHLRQVVAQHTDRGLSDRELLHRFATRQDQTAFSELVRRHGPMVLRVAQSVVHQRQDAEDVCQASFLVLARKAASDRWQKSVAHWLHRVAYHLALKARAAAGQRFAHESRASQKQVADPLAEITLREAQALLDEELNRLPEKYRAPLVLWYLETRTQDETARQLGWSKATTRRRLEQGRNLLRTRLARRGFTLSAAMTTLVMAQNVAPAAVPAPLIAGTVKAALELAQGKALAGATSAQVTYLVKEGLKVLAATKLKAAAVLLLGLGVMLAGVGVLFSPMLALEEPKAQRPESPKPQTKKIAQAAQPDRDKKPRLDLHGDPLPEGALARLGTVRWRHGDQVMAVVFSPDGNILASGSEDETIHVWDVKTGKLLRVLRGHEAWVKSVFFTPDGKQLISCGWDNTARVWSVATGKELRRWKIQGGWKLALSPDGKILAGPGASHPKNTIVLWDVATGNQVRELPFEVVHDGNFDLAFSPDGMWLACGGGSILRLFDVVKGKQLQTFGPGDKINSVAFSPDGKTLAVGRSKESVALWDIANLKQPRRLASDPKGAARVIFSRDGKKLATFGFGFTPGTLWDVATEKKVCDLEGTLYQVWSADFSPDDKTLAVGNLDSKIHLYDTTSGKELPSAGGHQEWLNFLAFVDKDRSIISASSDGLVRQWDLATAKPVREFQEKETQAYCGDLSPDERTLALGDGEGAHLFDWSTGKKLRRLKGNRLQLWAVAFSPKSDVLATAGNLDQNIILWDVESGKELRRIVTPYPMGLRCLAWSPNGTILASAGGKVDNPAGKFADTICLWNPMTGEQLREWTAHQRGADSRDEVMTIVFSPDGTLLASAGGDKTVGLWDAATGRNRARLLGHERGVRALAFSPDGRVLASGGADRTVRLWELATGKERRCYEGHLGGIPKLVFSKDGRNVASSGGDTSVLVWSITGRDPRQRESDVTLSPPELENLWNDLAGDDASRAWRAMALLTTAPKQTILWLQAHLRPTLAADPKRVTRLIQDLDSNEFATRQQAAQELEKLGELAESGLRAKLTQQPSAEARRQVERLLEQLQGPVRSPEVLRGLRSIELVEHIGTPEARRLLERLTQDAPTGRIEREVKASLDRLAKKNAAKP